MPVGPAGIAGRVVPAVGLGPGLSELATVSAIIGMPTARTSSVTIAPMMAVCRRPDGCCRGGPPIVPGGGYAPGGGYPAGGGYAPGGGYVSERGSSPNG